ncbi:MAG: alpha/beta hydrolase [Anaerolineae bacterium]|nr:alpha/beta hydrolase [Anaerolineae bacterium]
MMRKLLFILILIVGVFPAAAQEATPEVDPRAAAAELADANGTFVELNGANVYYLQEGPEDGLPVILLHGFLGSTVDWATVIPALAEADYRVVAFDRPPFGLSDKNPDLNLSLKAMSELTAALMDELGIETAALVGHSAGGAVVADFAVRYPERVEKLVFVAGAVGMTAEDLGGDNPAAGGMGMLAGLDPKSERAQNLIRAFFNSGFAEQLSEMAYFNPDNIDPEQLELRSRGLLIPGWEAGLLAFGRDAASPESAFDTETLKEVNIPVLLMWGEEDRIVPVSVGERLRDLFPNNTWITYPEVGHIPMDEATDNVNTDLLEFLDSVGM